MPPDKEKADNCGCLLRAFRLRAGLSQERLGQQAGVSPRAIRQIEAGRSQPRPATLKLLARTLNLSDDDWAALLAAALPQSQLPGDDPEPGTADRPATAQAPQQLPCAPRRFTGRALELAELDAAVGREPLWIISGAGGVGKTWLALHWAHGNAERFPDGQLYLNLRGFDPDTEPMTESEALRQLLYALNVDPSAIPRDTEGRSALYRSLLARRRVLVVLDNALDEAQVAALLPGGSTCTTLVTSRNGLIGLAATHGAGRVCPGFFDDAEALRALTHHIGEQRVNAEPDAAAALLRHCGGVPLAIGILAARAAAHPRFPLSVLAAELHDESDRLDAFDPGGLSAGMRSVFSGSVRQLSPRAARTFSLLGLAPNTGITGHAIASLVGGSLSDTRGTLRDLEVANLVDQYVPGRFRLHDLTRLYAVERSASELAVADRAASRRRFVDHYVHTAEAADRHVATWRERLDLGAAAPGSLSAPIPDRAAALWWFETEQTNVLAAQRTARQHGWHEKVWQLAWLAKAAQRWLGGRETDVEMWTAASQAAGRLDTVRARTQSHLYLGQALLYVGDFDEAMGHLRRALVLAESDDDLTNQIGCHFVMSNSEQFQGNLDGALPHALNAHRAACRPGGAAHVRGETLNLVGWTRALMGDLDRGRADCERALELMRDTDDTGPVADTLDSLGYIARKQRRYEDAREHFSRALGMLRTSMGARRVDEAGAHEKLGDVHSALGETFEALNHLRQARDQFLSLHRAKQAETVTAKIAALEDSAGELTPGRGAPGTPRNDRKTSASAPGGERLRRRP
ncbi:MAG: ATP-binding protein [Stackebrandtia sp.]